MTGTFAARVLPTAPPARGKTRGIAATVLLTLAASSALAQCPDYTAPASNGPASAPDLVEASGLAASRNNPGVLWAHNDSGHPAELFALGTDGAWLGTFTLTGMINTDMEDMAIGPGPTPDPYLYLGDIGDNANNRPSIRIYRVPEPTLDPRQPPGRFMLAGIQTLTLVYPDGPRDAESLMVDVNGDLYIVSKRDALNRVYRAPFPHSTTQTITLEFVATLPWGDVLGLGFFGSTGGDIAADGSAVVIRRYSGVTPRATLWLRPPGTDLASVFTQPGCNVTLASEPQGEAICFAPNCLSYYTLSEGAAQPIYYSAVQTASDLDHDGDVDLADLGQLLAAFGTNAVGDTDHDGDTDLADLGLLLAEFGATCP
jgi:hypothetical protein